MTSSLQRAAALLCVLLCAFSGVTPGLIRARAVAGFVERQIDTNGDGRADIVEYYLDGVLVRRVSDRNFNGVTDLVEDFDAVTRQPVRSIVDQDYDGTADVLLLYRDGEPVASERASSSETQSAQTQARHDSRVLVSLRNPFRNRRALESSAPAAPRDAWIGPTAAAGLVVSASSLPAPAAEPSALPRVVRATFTVDPSVRSPRGPPLA